MSCHFNTKNLVKINVCVSQMKCSKCKSPNNFTLGWLPKEILSWDHEGACPRMFTAAVFMWELRRAKAHLYPQEEAKPTKSADQKLWI